MTKQDQVARAADALCKAGERVSIRNVRRHIQKQGSASGSFRDIGHALAVSKAKNEYRAPRIETADLPERLPGLLAAFGKRGPGSGHPRSDGPHAR